jgi:hypothetical protein
MGATARLTAGVRAWLLDTNTRKPDRQPDSSDLFTLAARDVHRREDEKGHVQYVPDRVGATRPSGAFTWAPSAHARGPIGPVRTHADEAIARSNRQELTG